MCFLHLQFPRHFVPTFQQTLWWKDKIYHTQDEKEKHKKENKIAIEFIKRNFVTHNIPIHLCRKFSRHCK